MSAASPWRPSPAKRLGPSGGDEVRVVLEPVVVEPADYPVERGEGAVELLQRQPGVAFERIGQGRDGRHPAQPVDLDQRLVRPVEGEQAFDDRPQRQSDGRRLGAVGGRGQPAEIDPLLVMVGEQVRSAKAEQAGGLVEVGVAGQVGEGAADIPVPLGPPGDRRL